MNIYIYFVCSGVSTSSVLDHGGMYIRDTSIARL